MTNRVFADLRELRRTAESLIDQGNYKVTEHARTDHPEISEFDKLAIVRYGGGDKPDQNRPPTDGVYVCWALHPAHGLCRGVYAVEQFASGERIVVISVFRE